VKTSKEIRGDDSMGGFPKQNGRPALPARTCLLMMLVCLALAALLHSDGTPLQPHGLSMIISS
jgi:hypothetical protein